MDLKSVQLAGRLIKNLTFKQGKVLREPEVAPRGATSK